MKNETELIGRKLVSVGASQKVEIELSPGVNAEDPEVQRLLKELKGLQKSKLREKISLGILGTRRTLDGRRIHAEEVDNAARAVIGLVEDVSMEVLPESRGARNICRDFRLRLLEKLK